MTGPSFRFLFDEHVSLPAARALAARKVDVVHVLDLELRGASDARVLEYAREHGRILVTRNYGDFAPLAAAYGKRRTSFPGVLFIPSSIRPGDAGGLVKAISGWMAAHGGKASPVTDSYGWL